MAFQTGKGVRVAYKVEGTYNTAPGATGAKQFRLTPSPGLKLTRANIESQEVRSDGLTSMGRLGSRQAPGTYNGEISLGTYDELLEAVMRSTWVAAVAITVDNSAPNVSFQVTGTAAVAYVGTTTLHTKGLKVGDVCRFTNMSDAANNNKNIRIKSIAADGLSFTVHGTPLTVQGADTAATLTILRKLKNGAVPTKRTFYWEETDQDVDGSEVFGGVKIVGFKIVGSPDGMATIEFTLLGASQATLEGGSSPYFTTPTLTTSTALVFADAVISWGGSDLGPTTLSLTAFELTYAITAKTEPVVGDTVSPDIFDNDARLTGSVTFLRKDMTKVAAFVAETEVELHVMLVEPESEPKDCVALFVPRVKLTGVDKSLGGDGAFTEACPFTTGKKESTTGYDDTLLTISTSAA